MLFKTGDIVKHFKNKKLYRIIGITHNAVTGTDEYLYQPLYCAKHTLYSRCIINMHEEVKNMQGKTVPRFTYEKHQNVKNPFLAVKEFMQTMNQTVLEQPQHSSEIKMHKSNICEEFRELMEAIEEGNLLHIAKESADVLYVVIGLFHGLGIDGEKVFNAVHDSNMSKIGPTGKVEKYPNGKIKKSNNYEPPNLKPLFQKVN